MPDDNDSLKALLKQRKVLADFGEIALKSEDLDAVLHEACRLAGEALGTGRAKVLEIQPGGESLFVRAGVGWTPDVVGQVRIPMGENSSESFAIEAGEPIITQDIRNELRFDVPPFMKKAGVVALANVPIFLPGRKAYGLLQVDDTRPRNFDQNDTEFLRTYATILGPIVDRLFKLRELRSTEERFLATVEAATDYAIFVTDAEDRITDWLPGAEAVFGWSAEEAKGRPGAILFTPEDREAGVPEQEVANAQRDGRALNNREHLRKDGSRVFIEGIVRALHDQQGTALGFIKVGQDVTERRAAEERLRESQARRRLLQTDWETDAKGVVIADSPSWRAYTGQTLDEWLGYGWMDAIHPDDRAYAERQWREAIVAHGLVDAEFRLRAPDGGWRWTNVRAVPVLDAEGKIKKWAGMNIDIDARKRAEAALRESEARQAFLLRLGDALRTQSSAEGLIEVAARLLGEHLGASRIMFAEFDEAKGVADIFHGWFADGAQPFPAVMRLEDYEGPILANLRAGRTVRIENTRDCALARSDLAAIAELGVTALLSVPLLIGDRLVVNLSVHQHDTRCWTDGDVALVQEVAERLWADLVRARAEASLRESEERLRAFGEASSDALWIRDAETLGWVYLSPAFERIYGLHRDAVLRGNNVQNWLDLIVPEDREHAQMSMERVRVGERVTFEYRITRPLDGEVRLLRNTDFPIRDEEGKVIHIGGVSHDATEEQAMAERQKVLLAELQHRTRNLMGVVSAVTSRTLRGSISLEDFEERIQNRLGALSRANGLLSRLRESDRVRFDDLIRTELLGHGITIEDGAHPQVHLHGPVGLRLRSSQVQTLALGLHELATNALKYGALSRPEGRLVVTWRVVSGDQGGLRLRVEWRESGVPVSQHHDAQAEGRMGGMSVPRRSGYGRELIEQALPYQLGAETTYELGPEGLRCTITLPLSSTMDGSSPATEPVDV